MTEKLVIVPAQRTMLKKGLILLWFALTCLCLVCMILVNFGFFFLPAVAFGIIWYWQSYRSEIEYEYTYYDGDLRIARIKDKRRRKSMAWLDFEKNVIQIAPKGDRSVYKYENDRNLPYKNFGSGVADANVYELIVKTEKGIARYEFEPDEEMLDAMMVKYARVVIK